MKLILVVIFSLFFSSTISVATAQVESDVFYIFVQIIQRDNDGNLIGYLESDAPSVSDKFLLDQLMNLLPDSSIYEVNGQNVQLVRHETPLSTDASGLLSTVTMNIVLADGRVFPVVSLAHDGMRLNPDEKILVVWSFLRLV